MVRSFLEYPLIYKAWQAPFAARKIAPVLQSPDFTRAGSVLDIACGPGTNAGYFRGRRYLGIDLNPQYIEYAQQRFPGTFETRDARSIDSSLGQFDLVLLNSFLHHVDDRDATAILEHVNLVCAPDGFIHIIDLVMPEKSCIASYLAKSDRGKFARPWHAWEQLLGATLGVVELRPFRLEGIGLTLWNLVYCRAQRCGE